MREILFRGKEIETGEWVEGAYYHQTEFYGDKTWDADNPVDEHYIITSKDELEDNMMECYKVIPETVGQYTGLTDKNGTKIFEGDIVKLYLIDDIETGVIRYSENACRFMFYKNNIVGYGFDNTCIFKIIGNIHDNPEILEG